MATNNGLFDNGDLSDMAKKYLKILHQYENQKDDESDSAAAAHH